MTKKLRSEMSLMSLFVRYVRFWGGKSFGFFPVFKSSKFYIPLMYKSLWMLSLKNRKYFGLRPRCGGGHESKQLPKLLTEGIAQAAGYDKAKIPVLVVKERYQHGALVVLTLKDFEDLFGRLPGS